MDAMHCPNCGTEVQIVFGGKVKRASTMSEEQRKAVGVRLQTLRPRRWV
jgi:hypothetical protein